LHSSRIIELRRRRRREGEEKEKKEGEYLEQKRREDVDKKIENREKRREGDSNPRDAKHHRISNPAPYRAWLSRHSGFRRRVSLKGISDI
jgi:hypothetical protein